MKNKNTAEYSQKIIITENKSEFLQSEFKHFPFKNIEDFISEMEESVIDCHDCGILYWSGCSKRCDCRKLNSFYFI